MSDPYAPRPEHEFTFGLWTVGNAGRDPFGEPVRPVLPGARPLSPAADRFFVVAGFCHLF